MATQWPSWCTYLSWQPVGSVFVIVLLLYPLWPALWGYHRFQIRSYDLLLKSSIILSLLIQEPLDISCQAAGASLTISVKLDTIHDTSLFMQNWKQGCNCQSGSNTTGQCPCFNSKGESIEKTIKSIVWCPGWNLNWLGHNLSFMCCIH